MNTTSKTLAALMATAALGLAGCDVEKTQSGNVDLPKYEVTKTQEGDVKLPEYNVRTPDVNVTQEKRQITVPDVDVSTKEKTVTVPNVNITPAPNVDDSQRTMGNR